MDRLFPSLAAGLVSGILIIVLDISLAALLFSGEMSGRVSQGIGLTLFGSMVIGTVVALTSSYAGSVASAQESPAAIVSLMIAAIVAGTSATAAPDTRLATVVVTIALSTCVTGLFLLLLGALKLGSLMRYMPYPVVGGFLAGTGWFLALGGLSVMVDAPLSLTDLSRWLQAELLVRWLPGVLFALLVLLASRRYRHFLIIPSMLAAAVALFYVFLWVSGTSAAQAGAQGWFLGAFSSGGLWRPVVPSVFAAVAWPMVVAQTGSMGTVMFVTAISFLLNAGGIGVTVRQDLDLNRDLKSLGVANLISGLGGGVAGFHSLSFSALGHRLGVDSRLTGLTSSLLCGVVLFFGAPLISFLPRFVLGGLLLFLGLSFLVEWLVDGWFKLSRADYAIVWAIMLVMGTIGVLEGVGLGLALAVVFFVVNYSRADVVRHTLSGRTFHSTVERSRLYRQLLRQKGDWLYILELQGFIFFGTADKLLDAVRRRLDDPTLLALRFIVLDFRRVVGLDGSALLSFEKMKQLAEARDVVVVFTGLAPRVERALKRDVLCEADAALWRTFANLDHGVEWCEEQALHTFEEVGLAADYRTARRVRAASLARSALDALLCILAPEGDADAPLDVSDIAACVAEYVEWLDVAAGTYLVRQGEALRGLYIIETGGATVRLDGPGGDAVRLRKMGAGAVVGEIGFYLDVPATASVVVDQPSSVAYLSAEKLATLEAEAPASAAAFHKLVARSLGERLSSATTTIEALMK
ncbi:MAG: SLC26A/SulP transporter family protein [Anaerolineae bacterium]|nr:SLC26A/SulP transporter family protein [Anaerolineae bacterium]